MPNTKWLGPTPVNINQTAESLDSNVQIPATAAGAAVEIVLGVWNSPNPPILNSITVIPQASVATNGTNYVTFNLVDRGTAGAGTAILASANTSATGLTAYEATTLTIDNTQAAVQQGDVLTLNVVKAASGVATPPMLVILDWRY